MFVHKRLSSAGVLCVYMYVCTSVQCKSRVHYTCVTVFRLRLHAFNKHVGVKDEQQQQQQVRDGGCLPDVSDEQQQVCDSECLPDVSDEQQHSECLPDVYSDDKFHVIHAGLEKNLSLANYIVLVMTSYGHRYGVIAAPQHLSVYGTFFIFVLEEVEKY